MRPGNGSQATTPQLAAVAPHVRRESGGDPANGNRNSFHAGQGGRGGGRVGYNPSGNSPLPYQSSLHSQPNPHMRNGAGPGPRGVMAPHMPSGYNHGRGFNQANRSPAPGQSMPGTPGQGNSLPMIPPGQPSFHYQQPGMQGSNQVPSPFPPVVDQSYPPPKHSKKKASRRDSEKYSRNQSHGDNPWEFCSSASGQRTWRQSRRFEERSIKDYGEPGSGELPAKPPRARIPTAEWRCPTVGLATASCHKLYSR